MKSALITIGDEILIGQVTNTNAVWISQRLNDLGVRVEEAAVPIDESVRAASEMLGIDPLQAANEGKIVAVVDKDSAEGALDLLKDCPLAQGASVIGKVIRQNPGRVIMNTSIGGSRVVAEPSGELLPRIC